MGQKEEAHAFNLLLMVRGDFLRTRISCNYMFDKDASSLNSHFFIWSPSSHTSHTMQGAPTWLQSALIWTSRVLLSRPILRPAFRAWSHFPHTHNLSLNHVSCLARIFKVMSTKSQIVCSSELSMPLSLLALLTAVLM